MLQHPFHLAVGFDLLATFLAAVTGALAALRKRYDLVGVCVLALVTPLRSKPGEWYSLAAVAGCAAFAALVVLLHLDASRAAVAGIALAFASRLLSIRLGWRTVPLAGPDPGL